MAMGHNPEKTVFIEIGKMRPFSDIQGRHTIRLDNSAEKKMSLVTTLRSIGLDVNIEGKTDFLSVDFALVESTTKIDETDSGRLSRLSDEELLEEIPEKKQASS